MNQPLRPRNQNLSSLQKVTANCIAWSSNFSLLFLSQLRPGLLLKFNYSKLLSSRLKLYRIQNCFSLDRIQKVTSRNNDFAFKTQTSSKARMKFCLQNERLEPVWSSKAKESHSHSLRMWNAQKLLSFENRETDTNSRNHCKKKKI